MRRWGMETEKRRQSPGMGASFIPQKPENRKGNSGVAAGYSGKQMLALNLTLGDDENIQKVPFLLRGVVG